MTDWSVSFDAGPLRNAAIRFQSAVGFTRSEAILQQSVNRAGKQEAASLAKDIQGFVPVKLKYIRKRIKFRNADKTGVQARLRIYGRGTGGSAWIRPRHAKIRYSTDRPTRTAGMKGRKKVSTLRRQAISYGVGGPYLPSRTVLRGFVAVVGKGRRFAMPWSTYFQTQRYKLTVYQRVGTARLPLLPAKQDQTLRGVTVGAVAKDRGLLKGVGDAWQQAALKEYRRRVELELAKRLGARTP